VILVVDLCGFDNLLYSNRYSRTLAAYQVFGVIGGY